MIFVTVGTHEQPFNRLVRYIDKMVESKLINEEVIIQTGYSTYKPKYCIWKKFFSFNDMRKNIEEARIVITHGGPSSFIMALQVGKTPIVVPRKMEFNEHINNHQVDFSKIVAKRMGMIIVVEEIEKLQMVLLKYNEIVSEMPTTMKSNNTKFCHDFEKLVNEVVNKVIM